MSTKKQLWWEKTVEWNFAQSLVNQQSFTAAPLGGNPESAESDVRIIFEGKLALLEFKCEHKDCHAFTEWKKYARGEHKPSHEVAKAFFDDALIKMTNKKNFPGTPPHLFVYGEVSKDLSKPLKLELKTAEYWTLTKIQDDVLDSVKNYAVDSAVFNKYVSELANLRHFGWSGGGGGASVLGFSGNGVTVMDISDYIRLPAEPEPDQSPSRPSRPSRSMTP